MQPFYPVDPSDDREFTDPTDVQNPLRIFVVNRPCLGDKRSIDSGYYTSL